MEWSRVVAMGGSFEQDESPSPTGRVPVAISARGCGVVFAGTYGSGRTIRTCTVPQTSACSLMINYVVFPAPGLSLVANWPRKRPQRDG